MVPEFPSKECNCCHYTCFQKAHPASRKSRTEIHPSPKMQDHPSWTVPLTICSPIFFAINSALLKIFLSRKLQMFFDPYVFKRILKDYLLVH